MSRGRKAVGFGKGIEQYKHVGAERANNPPVGLVSPENDPVEPRRVYQYDPHLDPQLVWAGKAERTSFDVDTVSLHVHERIDPRTIIEAVRKKKPQQQLASFFDTVGERPPLRDAVDFYRHSHGWSNRLIAGDSLLVMNSLLQKEGMAGKIQMIYIDPPYGIKYGSNFQPFVNKRDVKDGKDEDLTQEPEMIKAFRDTWELDIHSYLTYLRDRLLLARELLTESGSIFIQISDENIHLIRNILDEIFGRENFFALITFRTLSPLGSSGLPRNCDYLLWYAKSIKNIKFNQLYEEKEYGEGTNFVWVEVENGIRRRMTEDEKNKPKLIPHNYKIFYPNVLLSSGYTPTCTYDFEFQGKLIHSEKKSWRTHKEGMKRLIENNRIMLWGERPTFIQYHSDFPLQPIKNLWNDTRSAMNKIYAVQTSESIIERAVLMTSEPGDLILDPTCGSGTTAFVAEQWGRRWITCDTSRVSIALAKQRLMTVSYDYYQLKDPKEGVRGGFNYKTVPHVTLKSIANTEPPDLIELYDQPALDNNKIRVTGPFTVEAVPAPLIVPIGENPPAQEADISVTRSGETRRQGDWRSELLKTGIRAKGGQFIKFTRVETLEGTRWLHAEAETIEPEPKKVVISFGPDYAPLEQKQVEKALDEARHLYPQPQIVIFAAFQFDPEAAKDIDAITGKITLLKVQMNADLLTEDLKKKRASNESFWLIGQPDIKINPMDDGKVTVDVNGFDYYDPRTGEIKSGGSTNIAIWMLDTDYDGRSLYPRQVFFPMADTDEGWAKLARNLKGEIDQDLLEQYHGNKSLPFTPGDIIAIKIVDDRGIESLKVIRVK